ncbi:type II toxin-antitoxin system VapC family toxin [Nocardioides acrostichi]|uniref:Ribonuclease VapC n=1 Tax=Nocardioides acrostichi TaxID=2784339 RepID=A0A930USS9_9ACTN|nr:type II toxin-antitoxin system VapC family toxin [Nocardioides acrostichi]MBF4160188.1 type II toxin-antitoxin system VapC family toxin [Nocardioides acrostichi]
MIVDSSAVMAVLETEPGWQQVADIAARHPCHMSTATWVELGIVADARSARHGARLDRLLATLDVGLVEVSASHARIARDADRRYGRGSGSPARLNFGDCYSYALATSLGEPLLFVGNDFTHTDVLVAAP